MRKKFVSIAVVSIAAAIAACVGDEPVTSSGAGDASTNDSSASGDGGGTDGSSATDSATDSGSFTPANLPGLALWLDDETIDLSGINVSAWNDKSPKLNHAQVATDGGATVIAPTIVSGGAGIGGRSAVHFNGTSNYLFIPDAQSLRWSSDFMIVAVVRNSFEDASTGAFIYAKQALAGQHPGPLFYFSVTYPYSASLVGAVDVSDYLFSSPDASIAPDVAHIVQFRWIADPTGTAGAMEVEVDGDRSTGRLAALPDITATGSDAVIGASGISHNFPFAGDIATIIAVNGVTSDADRASLTAYLKTRYGL